MATEDHIRWLCQEENRITKYQHQHRGLKFKKLHFPPTAFRRVNLIGRDNHIYRGTIPTVPLDQLPPEDDASIDEEALYKEIRDMSFPPVPEQEPLGPSRRVEGKYTLRKKLTYAPVQVDCTEGLEEILVLGKDSDVYRGKAKMPSRIELDKKLRGSKRPIQKSLKTSSTRGYVEPSLVVLHANDKPQCPGKGKKTLIKMPTNTVENAVGRMKEKSTKRKNKRINQNKEAECKQEDLESKATKVAEVRFKEIEMEDEAITEKEREAGTEISAERDAEVTVDADTKEPTETEESLSTGETTEKSETESLVETDAGESTGTEESLDSGEMKETTEESDTESLAETDTGESTETEESLDSGEMKETTEESDAKSLAETDAGE